MAQLVQKKTFGPQGNAKVTLGNKIVRIQLDGEVYELEKDAWPVMYPAGEYEVLLSKNFDKIVSVRPPSPGTHIVKFFNFGNRVNEVPQPKIQRGGVRQNRNGGTYVKDDQLVFTPRLEVVEGGQYDGLLLAGNLVYGFEPEPGTPNAMITMTGTKDLERFESFFRAQGIKIADVVIPYVPNILPWLETYLQQNGKAFMVTTNDKGFIESYAPVPAGLLKPTAKPKKAAAKKK